MPFKRSHRDTVPSFNAIGCLAVARTSVRRLDEYRQYQCGAKFQVARVSVPAGAMPVGIRSYPSGQNAVAKDGRSATPETGGYGDPRHRQSALATLIRRQSFFNCVVVRVKPGT